MGVGTYRHNKRIPQPKLNKLNNLKSENHGGGYSHRRTWRIILIGKLQIDDDVYDYLAVSSPHLISSNYCAYMLGDNEEIKFHNKKNWLAEISDGRSGIGNNFFFFKFFK